MAEIGQSAGSFKMSETASVICKCGNRLFPGQWMKCHVCGRTILAGPDESGGKENDDRKA